MPVDASSQRGELGLDWRFVSGSLPVYGACYSAAYQAYPTYRGHQSTHHQHVGRMRVSLSIVLVYTTEISQGQQTEFPRPRTEARS